MADVITRFRLETTQYDSKLRDAAKGLKEVMRVAELGGKDFKNFSDKAIENARALGQTASGATNAKDRLKDLVGSFNEAAKAYNRLSQAQQQSDFGKAMSQSLEQLQQRIKQTKDELYSIGDAAEKVKSSGLFGEGGFTGMLQVAGGSLIAQGATALASSMKDAVSQGIELARQGEGIRVAFERLNNPNLLNNLKEATHGTVSELELMKAAVKFDDFKLPVEELGTMLAFAQKKAKDTGQSIDYMVDSIVTGLGRKSLMILDNLGLSAAEIREKMKGTGDMTKAVGEIIREQMAKAGDYIETAADRSARATAQAQDKMMDLGRSAMPVAEEFNNAFNTIKVAGMQLLNMVLVPISKMINHLREFKMSPQDFFENKVLPKTMKETGSNVDDKGNYIKRPAQKGAAGFDWDKGTWKPGYYGAIYNSATGQTEFPDINVNGTHREKTTPPTTTPKVNAFNTSKIAFTGSEGYKLEQPQIEHQSLNDLIGEDNLRSYLGMPKGEMARDWGKELGKVFAEYVADPDKNKRDKEEKDEKNQTTMLEGITAMNTSLQNIFGGIQQLGFEVPQELTEILSVMQTITGIVSAIQTLSTVKLFGFAGGGVVKAFSGTLVGNTYSGDQLRGIDQSGQLYGLNAGEVVLNRAQVGNLASQLSGGMGQMQLEAVVRGEDLRFILNSNGRRTGRGEIVTTNFR